MSEFLEILQQEWAIRALLASTMVGLMCGVLGCFIVLRNMALVGDALAHAILPGVVFAFILVGYSSLAFFGGAVLAGLVTAVAITWIQQNVKTKPDAAIGIVFTAMFSIGVMGISRISRQEGVHLDLKDFLFGTVLGVRNEDLYLTAAVTVFVVLSVLVTYRYLFISTFQPVIARTMGISVKMLHYFLMLLLSFAVVAALQTVGVILVVAMLITPASTALLLSNRLHYVVIIAGLLGMFSAIAGLLFAIYFDTTPGPAMAVLATLVYGLVAFFAPENGLLFRWLRKRKQRKRIHLEDIVKRLYRLREKAQLSPAKLQESMGISSGHYRRLIRQARRRGWLPPTDLHLTKSGEEEAERLIRAHRLWETYLVDKMGIEADKIHEDAEKYEHLLPDNLIDEVDKTLGFPARDPHGSPIPTKTGLPNFSLARVGISNSAQIATHQSDDHITAQLWELGLLPGMEFEIIDKNTERVSLRGSDFQTNIPWELAQLVQVVESDL